MSNTLTPEIFREKLLGAKSICILGHISPDGDCIGSALSVYNFAKKLHEGEEDFCARVYLEDNLSSKFAFLKGFEDISHSLDDNITYDLAVVCDCGDAGRTGKYERYMAGAKDSMLVDHHITNQGFCNTYIIMPDASSTCEILFGLIGRENVDKDIAECIYTGIVHDTGVFHHSSTAPETMEIAGYCMGRGIAFGEIIDSSFYAMNLEQKLILGGVLAEIKERIDGKLVYGSVSMETRKKHAIETKDMDGFVDQIRNTRGALLGVFMYETPDRRVKVSMRSNSDLIDVSKIAAKFGGGGHVKAAGCFMNIGFEEDIDIIEAEIRAQLDEQNG